MVAPAHVVAAALGLFGLGLVAAAFVGEPFAVTRLLAGIGLAVVAMLVLGLQALNRHGGSIREEA